MYLGKASADLLNHRTKVCNGLTDEADFKQCEALYGRDWKVAKVWGPYKATSRSPCKDEAVARAVETLVLQLTQDYGGKATATELEKRFDQNKQIRSSGVGFRATSTFIVRNVSNVWTRIRKPRWPNTSKDTAVYYK